jgi:hypothetical protein
MAKMKQRAVLQRQANKNEPVEEVAFEAGEELQVLKVWADRVLVRKANDQLFNVPIELIEL